MTQTGAGVPAPTPPSPPRVSPSPPPVFPDVLSWKGELDEMFQNGSSHDDIVKRATEMFASLVLMIPKLTELGSPDVPFIEKHHQALLAATSPAKMGTTATPEESEDVSGALLYIQYPNPDLGGKGRADALLDAVKEVDPAFVDPRSPMTGGGHIQKGSGRRRKRTYRHRGKRTYRHSAGKK